jgi:coenzyme Q-binding protein COQ10
LRHRIDRRLPFAAQDVFSLVAKVEDYPDFIPWIQALRTWNRRQSDTEVVGFDAEAKIGIAFIRERFSTRVVANPGLGTVTVSLLSGPFRHLEGQWKVTSEADGCLIAFEIDFQFKNMLLQKFLDVNLDMAISRLIRCFEDRARVLYQPISRPSPPRGASPELP